MSQVEREALEWASSGERYLTQRTLGVQLGKTSHEIGRLLTHLGLREDGLPTQRAIQSGLARGTHEEHFTLFRWNEVHVLPLLRKALEQQQN